MKWIVRLIGLLLVVVVIVVGAVVLLPGDKIAKIASDQISAATGRKVEVSGDTRVRFYPVLGISTGKVVIANADWSDAGPMMTAESLKVGVDPVALFGGDIRITGLEAVEPSILLERASDGRVNWELGVEGVAASGQSDGVEPATSQALALTLDRALITGANLRFIDHGTGQETVMGRSDLDLRWPVYEGEATFDIVLRPAGQDIEITGRLDRVGRFLDGEITDMQATVTAPGGTLTFAGRGAIQPQLTGQFTANLKNTVQFLSVVGVTGVEIPKGLGQAITAKADITITPDLRVSLRETNVQLDNNTINGAADIDLNGERPRVNAQLRTAALDLSAVASGNSEDGSDASAVSEGWSKERIDASGLGLMDAELALVADSLDMGTFKFGKTRILTTIDNSRAVFDLRELRGYGGLVTGQFVANNRSGLSVGGNMSAKDVNMQSLLTAAAGINRFSTTGTAKMEFLGVGQSVDAIMKSLKGKGSVNTGNGHISGFDLDKLMRSGNGTGGTTVFDAMSATFTIAGGNLQNNDLLMPMPLARSNGEGRIGLGTQDLDYLFTPTLLEGDNFKGLAIPVRIRGPWANPSIKPDLEKALEQNLKAEKAKLKKKAKKEANKLLKKQLGVSDGEGESAEDKLKKGAAKEIFKLFD